MPTLGAPLDFVKLEARNLIAHKLTADPGSPVAGQVYYNTVTNTLMWYDSNLAVFVSARGGGAPAAHATSHQPGGSDPMAVDAAAATGSLRTIGTGALNACAGNDTRLTDSRNPTGTAGGDLTGSTYPNPVVAALAITDAKVATANKDGAAGTLGMRTLAYTGNSAMPGIARLDQIAAPTNPVALGSQRITGLADPSGAQDAATKAYVDTFAQGLDAKISAHAATTANIANVLTGAPNVLDGVTLAANDRVLVKDQTTPAQNGVYTITTLGTGANGVWARALDMDTWPEVPSAYVWVEMGTVNADTGWTCTSDPGGTLGTTAITWAQFSSAGTAIAGAGMTKTGNTLDVIGTTNRILVNADNVDIAATYVGQSSITTLGTITTGVWTGTTILIANGGTSSVNATQARLALGIPTWYTSATHGAGTTITILQTTHLILAGRVIMIQCTVEATGAVILPDTAINASGDVALTFSVSQSANTIRVILIGMPTGGSTTQPV